MLDLRLLATFREVAARGSFSGAAEALSFTQPAVSQHVARLEKQVGTRLLDRDARGVQPTRAGAALLEHAEPLLAAAVAAEAEVRTLAGLHVPEVRIGAFPTAAAGLVPMALRELRSARPDVRVRLRITEDQPAIDDLLHQRLDVALAVSSHLDELAVPDALVAHDVFTDPMLVGLPATHRLARRPSIELDELRDEQWLLTEIGGTCADSNVVRRACADAGFTPKVHFESEDYPALLGMTASGMGVTLIPSLAAMAIPRDVVVRPVAGEPPQRTVLALVRADASEDEDVAAMLDAVRLAGRRIALGVVPAAA